VADTLDVRPNAPLRLDVAARLAFPDGSIGVSALRREAARGRLTLWKIAGKDMTTLAEIGSMIERCRVLPSPPDCGSDRPVLVTTPSGSSSTEDVSTALAAARMRAKRLKSDCLSISEPNTNPVRSAAVVPIKRP